MVQQLSPAPPGSDCLVTLTPNPCWRSNRQQDLVWSGGDDAPMYQQYLGQMELSVYFSNGLLTVHSKL